VAEGLFSKHKWPQSINGKYYNGRYTMEYTKPTLFFFYNNKPYDYIYWTILKMFLFSIINIIYSVVNILYYCTFSTTVSISIKSHVPPAVPSRTTGGKHTTGCKALLSMAWACPVLSLRITKGRMPPALILYHVITQTIAGWDVGVVPSASLYAYSVQGKIKLNCI